MDAPESKPTRGRPKTFDRDRTLAVALDAYWREGPQAMSVNEVCRLAGVSKPGMYREFGSEDGLTDAVLARYEELVLAPLIDRVGEDRPFEETLTALIDFMTARNAGAPNGCLFAKFRAASTDVGPVTRAHVEALREASLAAYTQWAERARERGEIDTSVPVELAAAFIDGQFASILTQAAAGEDPAMIRAQARLAFIGLLGRPFADESG